MTINATQSFQSNSLRGLKSLPVAYTYAMATIIKVKFYHVVTVIVSSFFSIRIRIAPVDFILGPAIIRM